MNTITLSKYYFFVISCFLGYFWETSTHSFTVARNVWLRLKKLGNLSIEMCNVRAFISCFSQSFHSVWYQFQSKTVNFLNINIYIDVSFSDRQIISFMSLKIFIWQNSCNLQKMVCAKVKYSSSTSCRSGV